MLHTNNCCGGRNFYQFPRPLRKPQRLLDTTKIEIHTDRFVGERLLDRGVCCEPIHVGVEEKIQSFILHAATECLEPGIYYTLFIDHPLPDNIFADPTFIRVEKCGIFVDPVKLVRTETTFPMSMFDGLPKVGIPLDPAFPDDGCGCEDGPRRSIVDGDIVELGSDFHRDGHGDHRADVMRRGHGSRKDNESRLIPVELDLHGNTAFGDNFVKGIGPHPKKLQLYYTNRGTFSLVRPWTRRTDF